MSAIALALGIGIQNFPEGAAISLPLRQEGLSRTRSFIYGMLSGIVEPIFGLIVGLFTASAETLMPWLLSFAAGAMIYVVSEELIPASASVDGHSNLGTIGVIAGFIIMMALDISFS